MGGRPKAIHTPPAISQTPIKNMYLLLLLAIPNFPKILSLNLSLLPFISLLQLSILLPTLITSLLRHPPIPLPQILQRCARPSLLTQRATKNSNFLLDQIFCYFW